VDAVSRALDDLVGHLRVCVHHRGGIVMAKHRALRRISTNDVGGNSQSCRLRCDVPGVIVKHRVLESKEACLAMGLNFEFDIQRVPVRVCFPNLFHSLVKVTLALVLENLLSGGIAQLESGVEKNEPRRP